MAKVPVAGAVKTRLAREIGMAGAVRFARAAGAALLARVGRDPRWQTTIAVAPDCGASEPAWPSASRACPKAAATSARACSASSIAHRVGPS